MKKETTKTKGVRLSEAGLQPRTDSPEYINGNELQNHYPFTIFGATARSFRGQPKIDFAVAFKVAGELQKRVLTLTENDERKGLLVVVKREGAITNCRIIKIPTGDMGYWKIVDAADDVNQYIAPAAIQSSEHEISDDDIPW